MVVISSDCLLVSILDYLHISVPPDVNLDLYNNIYSRAVYLVSVDMCVLYRLNV